MNKKKYCEEKITPRKRCLPRKMYNGSIMTLVNAIFCIQNVAIIKLSYYKANYGSFS